MSGKYTTPKDDDHERVDIRDWCAKYITSVLENKELSLKGSPANLQSVIVTKADGSKESVPITDAALVFTDLKIMQLETNLVSPMVSGRPVGFVLLREGFLASYGKLPHSLVQSNDKLIPLGHPTTEASDWMWKQAGSRWLSHGSKRTFSYEEDYVTVTLLSALQSVLYAMSKQTDQSCYDAHMLYWMHLLDASYRYWSVQPTSQGPIDALWYDDKSNDTLQRAIACWIYPSLNARITTEIHVEKQMIMLEIMLRRHWKSRDGNKKGHNLWEQLPFGILTCTFLLPHTVAIVNGTITQKQVLEDMLQRYTKLRNVKPQTSENVNKNNALMIQHLLQVMQCPCQEPTLDDLTEFVKHCYDHSQPDNYEFFVSKWLPKRLDLPFPIEVKKVCAKAKENGRQLMAPRFHVQMKDNVGKEANGALGKEPGGAFGKEPGGALGKESKEPGGALGKEPGGALGKEPDGALGKEPDGALGKESKEPGGAFGKDTKESVPPGGLAFANNNNNIENNNNNNKAKEWNLSIEPSECGAWNGFVIPTDNIKGDGLKFTWKAFVCGGATIGKGRTWGTNGFASVRFTLSEFKEKGVHDILSRLEGVASSGVKYDPQKSVQRGGWVDYPVLDLTKPFEMHITPANILILSNDVVWWKIEHQKRGLIVGFNYLRFEVQPFIQEKEKPIVKSPVALLL